eukprot:jgi/Botrbrau1/5230/Bobra.0172s0093.1
MCLRKPTCERFSAQRMIHRSLLMSAACVSQPVNGSQRAEVDSPLTAHERSSVHGPEDSSVKTLH